MTPEQKVPTLETCKRLKEAGFPQDDIWYCFLRPTDTSPNGEHELESLGHQPTDFKWSECVGLEPYAAPDCAELLEALPVEWSGGYLMLFKQVDKKWDAAYGLEKTIEADTPAEALALLWLELKKYRDGD